MSNTILIIAVAGIAIVAVLAVMVVVKSALAQLRADSEKSHKNDMEALTTANMLQIGPMIRQLQENVGKWDESAAKSNASVTALKETMLQKMAEVNASCVGLGEHSEQFMALLKGGNRTQGNWGEAILSKTLTDAGLIKGVNYIEQTGDGNAGKPDVIVFCGENRKIVIDAKVNVTDFIAADNARKEGDFKRADELLKAHAKAVAEQAKILAAKRYPEKLGESEPESDFCETVIMAMPSEATYAAAVTADPEIVSRANRQGVLIASPQMLFGYLVVLRFGLERAEVARNDKEIMKEARMLIDRLDSALDELAKAGEAIDDAQGEFRAAIGHFRGNSGKCVLTSAKHIADMAKVRSERLDRAL